eukprot:380836-Prymnesium_polylepis.1
MRRDGTQGRARGQVSLGRGVLPSADFDRWVRSTCAGLRRGRALRRKPAHVVRRARLPRARRRVGARPPRGAGRGRRVGAGARRGHELGRGRRRRDVEAVAVSRPLQSAAAEGQAVLVVACVRLGSFDSPLIRVPGRSFGWLKKQTITNATPPRTPRDSCKLAITPENVCSWRGGGILRFRFERAATCRFGPSKKRCSRPYYVLSGCECGFWRDLLELVFTETFFSGGATARHGGARTRSDAVRR